MPSSALLRRFVHSDMKAVKEKEGGQRGGGEIEESSAIRGEVGPSAARNGFLSCL